ncbi:MAG TPA: hemerythrin domain-containing protein [Bacteroidales bacterium]|nr:hemerythrin domain-containing protein [Bacteroidales bacterium]
MKTATENLENDHVYILQLIAVMEKMTRIDPPETDHIEMVVDIIRNFADGIHHAKEENLLFRELGNKGLSPQQGPVAVMLHEHEEGRNLVRGIADNLKRYMEGEKGALMLVYSSMLGYSGLLRNHIAKENNILFRMADRVLSSEEQESLLAKFEQVENPSGKGLKATDYVSMVLELAARYPAD